MNTLPVAYRATGGVHTQGVLAIAHRALQMSIWPERGKGAVRRAIAFALCAALVQYATWLVPVDAQESEPPEERSEPLPFERWVDEHGRVFWLDWSLRYCETGPRDCERLQCRMALCDFGYGEMACNLKTRRCTILSPS